MTMYYHPDKYGLHTIGEIEWSSGSYQFDLTVVWADATGALLYGEDDGCSCPSPFDDMGVSDLTGITNVFAFQDTLETRNARIIETCGEHEDRSVAIAELIHRIIQHRKGVKQ